MAQINKLKFGIAFLLVIAMFQLTSAELYSWSDTYVNQDDQLVKTQMLIQVRDTSYGLLYRSFKSVPVAIYYETLSLPFDFFNNSGGTYTGYIDWCNLSVTQSISDYSDGIVVNTTEIKTSYYFNSGISNGFLSYNLRDLDSVNAILTCHFTDASSLFIESTNGGTLSMFTPATSCKGCGDFTFEELTQENERLVSTANQELSIYDIVYRIAQYNFKIWLYLYWVFKIGLVFAGFYLLFYVVSSIYNYLKDLENRI